MNLVERVKSKAEYHEYLYNLHKIEYRRVDIIDEKDELLNKALIYELHTDMRNRRYEEDSFDKLLKAIYFKPVKRVFFNQRCTEMTYGFDALYDYNKTMNGFIHIGMYPYSDKFFTHVVEIIEKSICSAIDSYNRELYSLIVSELYP